MKTYIFEIFVRTIDRLLEVERATGKTICIHTSDNLLAFRGANFRKAVGMELDEDKSRLRIEDVLRDFRTLRFIIVGDNEQSRFTNLKWFNGRPLRVITADGAIYEYLKNLLVEDNQIT